MGDSAASSSQDAVSRHRPCRARPDGRPPKNERPHPPAGGGTPNPSSCRRDRRAPWTSVSLAASPPTTDPSRPITLDQKGDLNSRPGDSPHTSYPHPRPPTVIHSWPAASRTPTAPLRGRYALLDPTSHS